MQKDCYETEAILMLTYFKKQKAYVWRGPFDQRHLPKASSFKWSESGKLWYTESPYVAYQLSQYADDYARRGLTPVHHNLVASKGDAPVLGYDLPYYPFQAAGIEHMLNQLKSGRRAVLCADEQGLGKTIEAIGVANELKAVKLLVVCPASLRLNWAREIEKWHVHNEGVTPLINGEDAKQVGPTSKSIVSSYNFASKCAGTYQPDLVIVDEVHYIKNVASQRTQAVLGNGDDIKGLVSMAPTLFLSGTPTPNGRPNELWPALYRCAPDVIDGLKYWPFVKHFCLWFDDGYDTYITGAKNMGELYLRLRGSGFMIRRLKKDVLKDLPPKQYKMVVFPETAETRKVLRKEKPFSADEIVKHGVPVGSALPTVRKEMGIAKVPQCVTYIDDLLIGGADKVVVFAHHKEPVARLAEGLKQYSPVVITGATPLKKRQESVDRFQEDPQVRVFIANEAAQEGWTLTAAHDVVLVEPEWVPGQNDQRADRLHRIGQTERVIVHLMVVEHSLDAKILSSAAHKADDIKGVLDNAL